MLNRIFQAVLMFVLVIMIFGCKSKGGNDKTFSHSLSLSLLQVVDDVDDEGVDYSLSFSTIDPILITKVVIIVDNVVWETEMVNYRNIQPLRYDRIDPIENVRFRLTNDSLATLTPPEMEDFKKRGIYIDTTDWDAYEKANDRYYKKVQKERDNLMNKFVSSLKIKPKVVLKAKGRLKNAEYEIAAKDIDAIMKVWGLYDEF